MVPIAMAWPTNGRVTPPSASTVVRVMSTNAEIIAPRTISAAAKRAALTSFAIVLGEVAFVCVDTVMTRQ